MIVHILTNQEKNELEIILKFLVSHDLETIHLELGLLKNYPYSMKCESDVIIASHQHSIGYFVNMNNIFRIITILEEIIDNGKYYSNECEDLVEQYD